MALTIKATALAAALWVAGHFNLVSAHGYLKSPKSRNVIMYGEKKYEATAGNCVGPQPYPPLPPRNLSPCGDPFQDAKTNFINEPGAPQATYTMGATIDLSVDVTVNHGGYFEFRLCPRKTGLTEDCFKSNILERADMPGETKWFMLDGAHSAMSVTNPQTYTMKYKLPSGLSCEEGCVLQWWWRALNSCIIPCDPKVCGFYAQGRNDITKQSNMATCPSDDPAGNSEVFANCADIRITGGGNGGQDPNKSENAPSSPAQTAPATHAPAPRTANPATTPSPAKSPVPTVPSEPTPSPAPPKPATTPSPVKAPAPAPKTAPAAPRPSSVQKPATIPSPTTEPPKSEGPRPSAPTSVQQPRKRFRTRSCNAWDCSTKRGFNKCRSYCTELRNTRHRSRGYRY